jgi:hypothetical protein
MSAHDSAAAAAAYWINPAKLSAANSWFEELYTMVYENLCPVPDPHPAVREALNDFFDSVRIVSLEDEEDEVEGSYFYSGYHDRDAVFYPFQDGTRVDFRTFQLFGVKWTWTNVLLCLADYAEDVEDADLLGNVRRLEVEKMRLFF